MSEMKSLKLKRTINNPMYIFFSEIKIAFSSLKYKIHDNF